MSDQNGNGNPQSAPAEGMPELEEVQIGDKKVMVSKGSKDLLMTQQDYTRKTQALAEERKKLEEQITANQQNIQVANNLMAVLSEDEETAAIMEAVIAKDKEKLKKLVMKGGGDNEDVVETLRKKIEGLENKLNTQVMYQNAAEKRKVQIDDARVRAKALGIDLDKYAEKITKFGSDNIMLPLAIAAASEDLNKQAEERGRLLGKKEALEELTNRLDNTPPVSGGSGDKGRTKHKDLRSATSAAYQELLSKQLGGG